MEWLVEYTEEFGAWWDSLCEAEQIDVAAVVELLEEKGPQLTVLGSMAQNMPICVNYVSSMLGDLIGLCMLLILDAWPYF